MTPIIEKIIVHVPYVGPIVQGIGIVLDVKKIMENSTPLGATKVIAG